MDVDVIYGAIIAPIEGVEAKSARSLRYNLKPNLRWKPRPIFVPEAEN